MATKTIDTNRTTHVLTNTDDTLYVLGKNASITLTSATMDIAMFASTQAPSINRDFRIEGDIDVATGYGLGVGTSKIDKGGDVLVTKTGSIHIGSGSAILCIGEGERITNQGEITGDNGIKLSADNVYIHNQGLISTNVEAIDLGMDSARLVNDGTIVSSKVAVFALTGAAETVKIINNGSITGGDDAMQLSSLTGGKTIVINHGTIAGADYAIISNFTQSMDYVRNTGSITGSVWLGDGNDTYNGRGGTASEVYGGADNDLYIVSDTATFMGESANEGTDTVRASVNWTLGANFENLTLSGTAGLTGKGNATANILTGNSGQNVLYGLDGADTLNGGKGDDLLYGGNQADIFVFSTGSGHDVVADFLNAVDAIDLRGVTHIDTFSDIQAAATQSGANVLLTFGNGETLQINNFSLASLTQDDFMF